MKESSQAIFENAIDFLERSLDEFKDSPKYSILHFAIAIEILLKARLSLEHWSLVVLKNPNKSNYLKGDFVSVNLDEAVKRLRDVVGENITDSELKSFKKLSAHRNKVIHFYHTEITDDKDTEALQKIIKEQCECWYHIKILFTKKWVKSFEGLIDISIFEKLDWRMRRHWEYLSTVFEKRKKEIETLKKSGRSVGECGYCSFEAVEWDIEYPELLNGYCLVCNQNNTILNLECECGEKISFQNEGWGTCHACGKKYEPEDVYRLIDDLGFDSSEWPDNITPANCQSCEGYHTIAAIYDKYICSSCFEVFETLGQCEWCNESCSGDLEGSYWYGCAICDGKAGWDA